MIAKCKTGKSISGLLSYLIDYKTTKNNPRGSIIQYNNIFGSKRELINQFSEVAKLSSRTEKPVYHCSFSFCKDDKVSVSLMQEISLKFSEEFGLNEHQWLSILHEDTPLHPHFHVVINRVNPITSKALSLNQNYKNVSNFCRKIEKLYGLEEVLNPRSFLPKNQRNLPRHDSRKEKLKETIKEALEHCKTFPEFLKSMNKKGIKTELGRGIAFIDDKSVRCKGSQLGFSLEKIKKQLIKNNKQDYPKNLNLSI